MTALPVPQHLFDRLTLKILLGTTEIAGNDGELLVRRVLGQVRFPAVGHGTDDNVASVVRQELGWHGLEPAAIEEIEKEGLDDVVLVVAEGDLVCTDLFREAVQGAATQA